MKRPRKQRQGAGGLEIIEEAVHLLRQAPGRTLGVYFFGAIPFVLGLLFFQADMSRSARAHQHAGSAAFGMALLFLWLKTWQAMFARELQAQIRGEAPPRWNAAALGNLALWQTIVQPAGLLLLPVAAALVLPFGWVFAFFQTLTALGTAEGDGARGLLDRGKKLALLWPAQNHALLLVLGLFAFVVYINLMVALLQLPALLKTFLGVETMFARSSGSWFNTTTFSTVLALAFLCVDPLIKAAYVLRCFYGESLQTGADLKADLARVRTSSAVAALVLSGGLWLGTAAPAAGAEASAKAERAPAVSPSKLERSIEEVLRQRQYEWRVPLEEIEMPAAEKGFIASFLDGVVDTISGWFKGAGALLKKVWDKIGEFIEWISEKFGRKDRRETNPGGSGIGWMTGLQAFAFVLLAVAVCAAVLFFWRLWKRRQGPEMVLAQAVAARPDLNDESVAADQLEEDGWIALARELAAKGDLRLALRALYLATLAHLARRELITIARFKSNREYERELRRRARAKTELQAAFATSVTVFDRAWYGMHEVNPETFRDFEGNLERMRAC